MLHCQYCSSRQKRPTKHAPDAGDSAARFASGSFLRLSIFLVGRLRRPRPSAGPRKLLGIWRCEIQNQKSSCWQLYFPSTNG